MQTKLLLTCEHAGNQVPEPYTPLFENHLSILHSHRGIDFGAYELSQILQKSTNAPLIASFTTRLLVELNRSPRHPDLFSFITKPLPRKEKAFIFERYYLPHRNEIEQSIHTEIRKSNSIIHIGVHSFTPELNGNIRNCDIGLLYDPKKETEKEFCLHWKKNMKSLMPDLIIRLNYPYQGATDGLTTYLRKKFPQHYLGIELEVNQKYYLHPNHTAINPIIAESLKASLANLIPFTF
jgi:predicted N-formylglutamate amidohydrolase